MRPVFRVLLLLALFAASALPFSVAQAQSLPPNCQAGPAPDGSTWVICLPAPPAPAWNGDLVIYAHGYVPPYVPAGTLPLDQFVIDGQPVPSLVTSLGYAFAATSYPRNGLSILEGVEDIKALDTYFWAQAALTGAPHGRTYLAGVSEGGLVTALAVERDTVGQFSGGLAACGPIGSLQKHVNYLGDFRVLFDYFFAPKLKGPLYMTASPIWIDTPINPLASNGFELGYVPKIAAALAANPDATRNLLATSRAAVDPADPTSLAATTTGILWYDYYATNDSRGQLAAPGATPGPNNINGNPFDNSNTVYRDPLRFGQQVRVRERFQEDPVAATKLATLYQTTGNVNKPLVTLHTILDPIVPFNQETLYYGMALAKGKAANVTPLPVFRYGHCKFTSSEVQGAFAILVYRVTGKVPAGLKAQPFDLGRAAGDFGRAQAESAQNSPLR